MNDSVIRFRSLHVNPGAVRLYGSGDSDAAAMLMFRSMPSYPALDNEGNSYRITLLSWFQTEKRIEVRLEIEPSPPRSVSWIELTEEIGSASRIDIGSPSSSRTVVDPLRSASPRSGDDILSSLVLKTLAHNQSDPDGPTRRDFERRQLDGIRRGVFTLLPPSPIFLRSLDELKLTLEHPEAGVREIPHSWVTVLETRDRLDGPSRTVDPDIVLEPIDGVTIGVDTVVSEQAEWLLYLTAKPNWSIAVEPGVERDAVRVTATDDRGGTYIPWSNGGMWQPVTGAIQCMSFRPRLNPEATELRLVLSGPTQSIALSVGV